MTQIAHDIAAEAAAAVKREFLIGEHRKTRVAANLGVNRATVARWLNARNPPLSVFLDMAAAVGADPSAIIADAVNTEKKKMPAADTAGEETRKDQNHGFQHQ